MLCQCCHGGVFNLFCGLSVVMVGISVSFVVSVLSWWGFQSLLWSPVILPMMDRICGVVFTGFPRPLPVVHDGGTCMWSGWMNGWMGDE